MTKIWFFKKLVPNLLVSCASQCKGKEFDPSHVLIVSEEVRCVVPELENGYYSGYRVGESILLVSIVE